MKKISGNLVDLFLDGEFDVLIHGCNCCMTMGAGIAGEIAVKIPEALIADQNYGKFKDINKLGNYSMGYVRRQLDDKSSIGIVVNLYSQYLPGKDLCEEALLLGFIKLSKNIKLGLKIGIPAIGCGIAGGVWDEISPKIENIMQGHDITYVEFVNNNLILDERETKIEKDKY